MPRNTGDVLKRYKKVLVPELNSGQLLMLIRAKFLIPVFHTGTPPVARPVESAPSIMDAVRGDLRELLAASRIQATFSPAGLPQSIVCPPSRYLATILIIIAFDTIWTAMCVLLISKHAPLLFALVFYVVLRANLFEAS